MENVYTVVFENVSVSAAQDLFELQPADDHPCELIGLFLANVGGTADAGDAQEEMLRLSITRGHTTSGSGGTTPTPRPVQRSDGLAATATAEVNNTTIASAGTTHDLHLDGWNVRVPYQMWWPDGVRPRADQGDTTIVVRLDAAPADAVSMSGTLYYQEY